MKFTVLFLILTLSIFLFLLVSFPSPPYTNDYIFHFHKATGAYTPLVACHYTLQAFNSYPPLTSIISFIPTLLFYEKGFQFFWILFFILIVPLTLYFITKSPFSFLLYFTVPFLYASWASSIYAQALVSFLALLLAFFLLRNRFLLSFLVVVLMYFTHSQGVPLALLISIAYVCHKALQRLGELNYLPKFALLLFPAPVGCPYNVLAKEPSVASFSLFNFVKFFPVQYLYYIRCYSFPMLLAVILFISSLFSSSRILNTASLFFVWGLSISIDKNDFNKYVLFCVIVFSFLVQLFL